MNRVKTNTTSISRISRECRCDDQKQTANTRAAESNAKKSNMSSKSCMKKASSEVIFRGKEVPRNQEIADRSKTWFQVLLESPKKSKSDKILETNRNQFDIPCRYKLADGVEASKENCVPRSENTRRFNLLVDMLYDKIGETTDKNFLKIIADVKTLLENSHYSHSKHGDNTAEYQMRHDPLTDDDKYNFQKPVNTNERSNKTSDNLLKILLKETKEQRELLQNLTSQLSQLREENKMLNQLRNVRINLESKLASRNAENKYLKREYDRAKRLLEMRDRENEDLRNRLSNVRGTVRGKINHVLDNFADNSIELQRLNDSIASVPSHEISFDMPIRPASSSPTENLLRQHTQDAIHVSKMKSNTDVRDKDLPNVEGTLPRKNSLNEAKLKELKDNVNKLTEVLEADVANLNANDVSLNLSDVTYKWSV